MNKLEQLYQFFKKFNMNLILDEIFQDSNIQDIIFRTIKNRLANTGLTASLKELVTNSASRRNKKFGTNKKYSAFTERKKKIKSGLAANIKNVTLFDTGTFYNSFRLATTTKTIRIIADMKKENGDISDNFTFMFKPKEFEQEILNLTKQEKSILLKEYVLPEIQKLIRDSLKSIR